MAKKRKTELDVDLDLKLKDITKEEIEEAVEKPPEEEEKGPRFQLKALPPKILILIGSLLFVAILIISGIIYYLSREEPTPELEEPAKEEAIELPKVPQYQFAPFFYPIKTKNNKEVFLKIAFSIDLSNELVVKEIEETIPLLRANLSILLGKKNLSDLESDPDKAKLNQEIIGVLNRSLQNGTVKKVYFTQFFFK